MQPIERLGAFYLGAPYDLDAGERLDEPLVYDARDLTTHAVCVGMTGSGKTGLCVGLLEEAALDGVPALILDPKGDITNLLLTFPELRSEDFEPWIDSDAARRKGRSVTEHADATAKMWREGLADWGQDGERIRRLRESAEFRVYTPGSDAGLPVSILASLKAPTGGWDGNEEALREQITGTVKAILGLAGIKADPLQSREHILMSNIFEHSWRAGRDLDLAQLIGAVQSPPMLKLGVFDIDTFYPQKDRFTLAMALNNILASPSFARWFEGDPLDIGALLHAPDGRPRHCIFSTAHLDDDERMFFTTLLLEQTLAWIRRQPGTTSLRALLYMDEVFGYLPPTANPPSKTPLLTLLKQARAFGLGVVLTTQNPVDLDYKALSNAGTWFLGKMQTEQDKARVLDGLVSAGGKMDRKRADMLLSSLRSRTFLLHNVHDDEPTVFHTRWVMSYLRGPLTREQIRTLKTEEGGAELEASPSIPTPTIAPSTIARVDTKPEGYESVTPALPPTVTQVYAPVTRSRDEAVTNLADREGRRLVGASASLVYEPVLGAFGRVAFVDRRLDVDEERDVALLVHPDSLGTTILWDDAEATSLSANDVDNSPEPDAFFAPAPIEMDRATKLKSASKSFRDHLYRDHEIRLWHCPPLKLFGLPDESESEFLGRARLAARELRDAEVDKMKDRAQKGLDRLEKKLVREERELEEDRSDYSSRKQEELLSAGETLVGMLGLFGGRKRRTGLSSAARKRRMTANAKMDIEESEAEISALLQEIEAFKAKITEDAENIAARWEDKLGEIDTKAITPRRTDVRDDLVALTWIPYWEISYENAAGRMIGAREPASGR